MKHSSFTKDLSQFKSDLSELAALKYSAQGLVEDIGVRISLARTEQGLSQRELAKRARIDQGDVSRIENGEIATTVFTLGKILHVLDLNFEILTFEQQKKLTALPVQKAKKSDLGQKRFREAIEFEFPRSPQLQLPREKERLPREEKLVQNKLKS